MKDNIHSHPFKSMTVSTVTHASDDVMMLRCTGRLVLGEDAEALRTSANWSTSIVWVSRPLPAFIDWTILGSS